MSHHIYHTDAFVLGSTNIKEADKLLTLFTRELGTVLAIASGVRNEKSKLRFCVQDFSCLHADLIRGKQIWRLTSGSEKKPYISNLCSHREKLESYARVLRLVKRLIPGEKAMGAVFDGVEEGTMFLQNEFLSTREVLLWEAVVVMRVLNGLGYWGEDVKLLEIFQEPLTKETLNSFNPAYAQTVRKINHALKESQL